MKIIIFNIRTFMKKETILFFIAILCIFFSSIILCFSYGIFINYQTEKQETELDLNNVYAHPQNDFETGHTLTKSMLKEYLMSVSDKTKDNVNCFYCTIRFEEFDAEFYADSAIRFGMKGNEFKVSEVTRDNWEENGIISSGRYFTDEEERMGKKVALVGTGNDWVTWNEATLAVKTSDNTILLGGKEYTVVGTAKSTGAPIVPFESLDDDTVIYNFGINFTENITSTVYKELVDNAAMILGDRLKFDDIDIPDNNDRNLMNNLIFISAAIAIISVLNFTVPYKYILSQRSRNLAIFRMNGCTVRRAVMLFLMENLVTTVPVFALSAVCYHLLMKNVLTKIFPYIEGAYNMVVYIIIAAVYLLVLAFALIMLLFKFIKRDIKELLI